MARTTMIKVRRDSSANWVDVVLAEGEFGYDTTTKELKIGDGTTVFQSLGGINADMLDGEHGFSYATSTHTHAHDALTGLTDDDHGQYAFIDFILSGALENVTREGVYGIDSTEVSDAPTGYSTGGAILIVSEAPGANNILQTFIDLNGMWNRIVNESGGAGSWIDMLRLARIDEMASPTDVTTLNVSASAHGLCPKVDSGGALIGNIVALSAGESQASWCQIRMDNLNDVDYNASNIGNVLGLSDTGWTDIELSHSIYRQAIINGNFDVWQRGTTVTNPAQLSFLADRWNIIRSADGGTLPTIIHSRQALTSGEIDGSFYFYRINVNGAGSSLGDTSYCNMRQKIEHGTRYLCGSGKKVTLSFKARSSISGKKIGFYLLQNYGTGGSPSSDEILTGSAETLTSDWQSFSFTFDTNALSGKTFGINNDDYLAVELWEMWGSNYASRFGESTAEDFGGSGNIDIAQVQVCAGEVALPFQPKSYDQEYRDCLRYFERFWNTGNNAAPILAGGVRNSTTFYGAFLFKEKRISPTITISNNSDFAIETTIPVATSGLTFSHTNTKSALATATTSGSLTAGHGGHMRHRVEAGYIDIDAEL